MANIKLTRVPVASHGLHNHKYNFPFLSSYNFMDVCPVFINPLRKGESIKVNGGAFSRLNPIVNPAFATGRYNFKAFFLPWRYIWKPWYHFDEGTEYHFSNGTTSIIGSVPYTTKGSMAYALVEAGVQTPYNGATLWYEVQGTGGNPPADGTFDFSFYDSSASPDTRYFVVTALGNQMLKVLGSLGYSPSWYMQDTKQVNIMPLLAYIRIYLDYYFPSQYVGGSVYDSIISVLQRERVGLASNNDMIAIVNALRRCLCLYYDGSILDLAFDNPVGSNTGVPELPITLPDTSNDASANRFIVSNDPVAANAPNASNKPTNGTPFVGSVSTASSNMAYGVLTQYIIDGLQVLNNFVQRHRLAGGRLLERFLTSRGIPLSKDVVEQAYFLGERNLEIEIDAVENNSDTNLGELAGKGIASTNNEPLKFDCKADEDGIFMVVLSVVPDASVPVLNDPWNSNVKVTDFMHSAFDKLGATLIPRDTIQTSMDGYNNQSVSTLGFGFWPRYTEEIMDRTRLLGDFVMRTRGRNSLNSFHTFRNNWSFAPYVPVSHSLDFLNSLNDKDQYQRLFYSDKVDNMHLFIRWYGEYIKEKLPLGESIDWDDDEYNKKVEIVRNGLKV